MSISHETLSSVRPSPVLGQLCDLEVRALPPKLQYTQEECAKLFEECFQTDVVQQPKKVDADSSRALQELLGGAEDAAIMSFWKELDDSLKGQFLVVLDKKGLEHVQTLITQENPRTSITACFVDHLKASLATLSATVATRKQHSFGMDENAVRAQLLPFALANELITSKGFFNSDIIDTVKNVFFLKGELANQKVITDVLTELATKGTSYDVLMSVKAPASKDVVSWAAITAQCGEVTERSAKVAALSACLAPVAKSSVDNDLALQFGTLLRQTNLARFVEIVATVIEQGKLTRFIAGQPQEVAFTFTSTSSPLMTKFNTTVNGSIEDKWFSGMGFRTNTRLWEVPGMVAACKAMGIENVEQATKDALKALVAEPASKIVKEPRYDLSAYDVISKMGDNAALGHIAFTATYENPFMRGMLNMLTEMATIRGRSHQIARIYYAVQHELHTREQPQTLEDRAHLKTIFRDFLARFGNSLKSGVVACEAMAIEAVAGNERLQNIALYFKSPSFTEVCTPAACISPSDLVRVYKGSTSCHFTPKSASGLFGMLVTEAKKHPNDFVSYLTTDKMVLEFVRPDAVIAASEKSAVWDDYQKEAKAQMNLIAKSEDVRKDIYEWVKTNLITQENAEAFDETMQTLVLPPTFATLRDKLHEALTILSASEIVAAQAHEERDSYLVTKLLTAKPHLFATFAKSTTKIEGHDVELMFYPDPILNETAVGMLVNGSIRRLDQAEWLNAGWEFGYTAKAEAK